jgi:anti-sigma regulatory factor (Ser/Thr protein kinase)
LTPLRLAMIVHILDSAGVDSPPSIHDVQVSLPEDYGSPALAREFTQQALHRWQYRGRHDDVILIVSELVANALVHGHGAPVLRLCATPSPDGQQAAGIRVEVSDDSPVLPAVRGPGPVGGLGLRLVERLGAGWGAAPRREGGKVVWCELAPGLDRDAAVREATPA